MVSALGPNARFGSVTILQSPYVAPLRKGHGPWEGDAAPKTNGQYKTDFVVRLDGDPTVRYASTEPDVPSRQATIDLDRHYGIASQVNAAIHALFSKREDGSRRTALVTAAQTALAEKKPYEAELSIWPPEGQQAFQEAKHANQVRRLQRHLSVNA